MPAARIDLTGRTFGSFHGLEFDAIRAKTAYWRCECDCGRA